MYYNTLVLLYGIISAPASTTMPSLKTGAVRMDATILDAVWQGLTMLLDPSRLVFLVLGVMLGLFVGMIPGIGGVTALALLLPFTFGMDPYAAFALLLGVSATTSTGDTIPAVMFGVPGGAGSAATVMDGYPMAKNGEAGRALSAAYLSSLIGGLFGAILLAIVLPFMRPVLLHIGSPELLSFAILGLSLVAVLSGSSPMRGMAVAGVGILLAMIGMDSQTGTARWHYGTYYLWDGLPLVPVLLGLFALPELCDLAISRRTIARTGGVSIRKGMLQGARDVLQNLPLVFRSSWLGAAVGAIPGLGGSVVDWLAYGFALKTIKGASETFGKGDVRGVIGPESANNAKEGGALVPTIVFGIPGTASMTILLGAFLIHGLVPGPTMLTQNLSLTYSMVWSIALANILGAGLCFAFSGQFAKIATLRYTLILPCILSVIFIGAFEGSRQWGDLYALILFGVLGWIMKQLKWPRPPMILGFVLGSVIERYSFISYDRYGIDFLFRPVVLIMFAIAILALFLPLIRSILAKKIHLQTIVFRMTPSMIFSAVLIAGVGLLLLQASAWLQKAQLLPMIVGIMTICFALLSMTGEMFSSSRMTRDANGSVTSSQAGHMDSQSDYDDLTNRQILLRAAMFLGWLICFLCSIAIIGIIPSSLIFVTLYMRIEGQERWRLIFLFAIGLALFIFLLFDQVLSIPWPPTVIRDWFPALDMIPSI
jgi:TctA family transporter